MNGNEKTSMDSDTTSPSPVPNHSPTDNAAYDYTDPDAYLYGYLYDGTYYDSVCTSCVHWNASSHGLTHCMCNYEPRNKNDFESRYHHDMNCQG